VEITFRTKKFAKICNDGSASAKELGPDQARRLRRRLDDLRAATRLADMGGLPGRNHELKGDRRGQLSIDLVHPYRLIFEPAHVPPPRKQDGGLDWAQVTEVEVIEITDTHD